MKKNGTFSRSFAKERNVLVFLPVLYKRMGQLLRSFPFFTKEWDILFALLGLISRQKLKKRMGKNGTLFKRAGKTSTF